MTRTKLFVIALMAGGVVMAGGTKNQTGVTEVKDVETLNDNIKRHEGKKVAVTGEVVDKISAGSFILENGGMAIGEYKGQIGSDFTPDVETRLASVKTVLVAESVAPIAIGGD